MNLPPELAVKENNLRVIIRSLGRVVVAYSGGVDSTVIAKVAHEELGDNALLVIADSPSLPRCELTDAKTLAYTFHLPLRVVPTDELDLPNYQANPSNRCYYCKDTLYKKLQDFLTDSSHQQYHAVLNGDHYEDNYGENFAIRPGGLAAQEHGVHSPLRSARFTKADIRTLAKKLGLPNAEKPASPCLSSRIPTGSEVTVTKLAQIEQAEQYLRTRIAEYSSTLPILRVRHFGEDAKIEVTTTDKEIVKSHAREIVLTFKKLGFSRVYLSAGGYISGGLSELKNNPQPVLTDELLNLILT